MCGVESHQVGLHVSWLADVAKIFLLAFVGIFMSKLVQRIDEMIEERSLLKHPFYEMWSAGNLTKESLAGYSMEYFQLVKTVPLLMIPIIEQAPQKVLEELRENQQEEFDHITPWLGFAAELGVTEKYLETYMGLEKTNRAVLDLMDLSVNYESGVCAMYALEKEIPKISQTKLDGLAEFYGITSKDATKYFKLHTEADIRHAASWRNMIEQFGDGTQDMILAADKSISAQNMLLDACYEAYC